MCVRYKLRPFCVLDLPWFGGPSDLSVKRCGKLATEKNRRSSRSPMPDTCTVLPALNLLDLIEIRADPNDIILFAKTSASTARCPACGKRSGRVHS